MAKKSVKAVSPPVQLLNIVWENALRESSHSWGRLNTSMSKALQLAVGSGMPFGLEDIRHIMASYRTGYWIGDPEWVYSVAVSEGNLSAAQSYEAWKERGPFIADGVSPDRVSFAHSSGSRVKERLAVGFRFKWNGESCTVTSFANDGASLTACSYKGSPCDYPQKIKRRYKITAADIQQARANDKRRSELEDVLIKTAESLGTPISEVIESLGAKNRAEFEQLPIARIEKLAAKLTKKLEAAAVG